MDIYAENRIIVQHSEKGGVEMHIIWQYLIIFENLEF